MEALNHLVASEYYLTIPQIQFTCLLGVEYMPDPGDKSHNKAVLLLSHLLWPSLEKKNI